MLETAPEKQLSKHKQTNKQTKCMIHANIIIVYSSYLHICHIIQILSSFYIVCFTNEGL